MKRYHLTNLLFDAAAIAFFVACLMAIAVD